MKVNYANILRKIEEVSKIDSQPVNFVKISKQECPDCSFDPITGEATNSRCTTCGGDHYITTEVITPVIVNVEYVSGMETLLDRGGKLEAGTVNLTVHVTELEKNGFDPAAFNQDSVDFFDVNGRRYVYASHTPSYLHGTLYDMEIQLKQFKG